MKSRHLKVVNPVRFFIFILISIMIIAFAGYSIAGARAEAAAVHTYAQVVIHEGDTLWDIVEEYNPNVHKSTRAIIREISETNDIDVNNIQPGDRIFVPVY